MAGESRLSRLRASISSLVTASASRLPNFTFPSLPVRQWVLISHRTPVRAPRPGILTFSTPRPARLTHPDREYFPPVGCWREPPGHTTCLSVFTCPTQRVLISRWTPVRAPRPDNLTFQTCCSTRLTRPTRRFWNHSRTSARASGTNSLTFSNLLLDEAYPSDTAILKPQSDIGESLRDRQLSFSILRPARPTQPRCRLTARPSDPLNFAFLSKPIRLGEPRSPAGRRREHSRPDNLIFSSPRSTRLTCPTRRFWNHSRTSARASQPDNLTFQSPMLGKAYPSDTALVEATVGRWREPPSQTNSSFRSARTTISNPVERYVPGHSGNLSFQSTTGEVQPSDSRVLISRRTPQEPPGWTTSPFPPTSAKLTHQTGGHARQWDVPSSPVRHSESWSPVGRRREHSRPDNLAFSSPTLATLTHPTQRVLCPRWASARASQRDDLPLPTWQTRLTR